jgi:type IV fimbrial biogenesis protein FimT
MRRPTMRATARGFTLVELMVTLTVASVLLVIAVPSFRNLIVSNALTTAANELVGALNLARMEAVKRNASVQFCSDVAANNTSDALGAACGAQGGAVYVWTTGSPATVQVRDVSAGLQQPVQLHGHIAAIRYSGEGLGYQAGSSGAPYSGTVVDICSSAITSDNHRIVAVTTGSIISTSATTGTCP